jgi:insecticidal toxin complex protein TccC
MSAYALSALHVGTPDISTAFRALRYLRAQPGEPARVLITRTVADPFTRTARAYGARRLDNPATGNADALTITTPGDDVLMLHTADGDVSCWFNDAARRPLWSQNAQGTVNIVAYEPASEGGRPLTVTEHPAVAAPRVREQYEYASTNVALRQGRNLAGTMTVHKHNAGWDRLQGVSITGQRVLSEQRLVKLEAALPNWGDTPAPDTEEPLTVQASYDATGASLTITNAVNVTSITVYDINGAVGGRRLRYQEKGASKEVTTFSDLHYGANGVAFSQTAGNGVTEAYSYDPRAQRLTRHSTARPAEHVQGQLLISDLHYEYDPVGNILRLEDKGADPQWHNNQAATGLRGYTYDTLYRLQSATGRERTPVARYRDDPSGGSTWLPYTEAYLYDDADNLISLRHCGGAGDRTRQLSVAVSSNRALVKNEWDGLETGFLMGGLQKQLANGRQLQWYADSQLQRVSLVTRADEMDDTECYYYANNGTRIRKIHTAKVAEGVQATVNTYWGGCEVRQRLLLGQETLHKHIVITEAVGVRLVEDCLAKGMRLLYGFSDHLGSTVIEADARGRIVSRAEYAPYGGTLGSEDDGLEISNLTQRTHRYSGKELDATGLVYYGWRYYQPNSGRWLSADPGGLVDGINLFRFCQNNPVNIIDTDGKGCVSSKAQADPDNPLVKSLGHARENLKNGIQPSVSQHLQDRKTMTALVASENSRKGRHDGKAPGNIEYYDEVSKFVTKLIEDQSTPGTLHYQAVVHMAPKPEVTTHFTAFDVYRPTGAERATLINIESAFGMLENASGTFAPKRSGGVGKGLRYLHGEVLKRMPDTSKQPALFLFETKAQKSSADCGIFSLVNARAMSQFSDELVEMHEQFASSTGSSGKIPDFISLKDNQELSGISVKFFKYTHSKRVLDSLGRDPGGESGDKYNLRNEKKGLRVKRFDQEMNIGIERKRIKFLQYAINYHG